MNKAQKTPKKIPKVSYVPAFDDNYIWFIHGLPELQADKQIIIVDPGDEEPVIDAVMTHGYQPQAIFITHHHGDHTGGIKQLVKQFQIPVYGPAKERIAEITFPLSEPQTIAIQSMGLEFQVLDVPGHTLGHIAYYNEYQLFIGDTLFAGGCGRLFEGTAQQMHQSLCKLLDLSDDTMVYCAHEYTEANLKFALHVEPENPKLLKRIDETRQLRDQLRPTVPSLLKQEKQTNPFLRFDNPTVKTAAEKFSGQVLKTPAEVFKTVRYWKDTLD